LETAGKPKDLDRLIDRHSRLLTTEKSKSLPNVTAHLIQTPTTSSVLGFWVSRTAFQRFSIEKCLRGDNKFHVLSIRRSSRLELLGLGQIAKPRKIRDLFQTPEDRGGSVLCSCVHTATDE